MADTQAYCKCGCTFAAHRQHLGKARQDSCDDHGLHYMTADDATMARWLENFGFMPSNIARYSLNGKEANG